MVATPQIGRKLVHKRKERQLIQQAVQQIAVSSVPVPASKLLPTRHAVTGTDWQQTFETWTQSHAERPSGLTPDMLRRENLYGGDEDA